MKKFLPLLASTLLLAQEYSVQSLDTLQDSLIDAVGDSDQTIINLQKNSYHITSPLLYSDTKSHQITINCNHSTLEALHSQIFVIDNNQSTVTFNECIFENGETNESGGAILSNGEVVINNSSFKRCQALTGGAISAQKISTKNSHFRSNSALYGGALDAIEDITIDTSTFKNNNAQYGGAILAKSAYITKSIFSNNHAEFGGAISVDTNFTLLSSSFSNNSAQYGGAIMASTNSQIKKSSFFNNFAIYGGAIAIDEDIDIQNALFINNQASYAGALFANNFSINNTTFIDNFASKYASALYGGGKIENSIFVDKIDEIVLSSDLQIANSSVDTAKIYQDTYTLQSSNLYNFNKEELAFYDLFRLSENSKARDLANSNATIEDIDGNIREEKKDLGASEYLPNTKQNDLLAQMFIDSLKSGWNLVSFNKEISTKAEAFKNVQIIWIYRDGEWQAFTLNPQYATILQEKGIKSITTIHIEEGVWIYK